MGSQLQSVQDEILRRFQRPRTTLNDIPGYAGGNLGDQIDREGQSPDRMSGVRSSSVFAPPRQTQPAPTGQVLTPTNQTNITQPRSVFAPPLYTNSEGITDFRVPKKPDEELSPVSMSRDRRVEPRDYIADDSQYLRDLEDKPRTWKDKAVDVLRGVNQAFGANPNIFTPTKREREILKAQGMLGRDIALEEEGNKSLVTRAQISERLSKPPAASTRIVGEGEYDGVPAGTEIRQTWDANQKRMVDVLGLNRKPIVSKPAPQKRATPSQIEYENGKAMLVIKDPSGPSVQPILKQDGTPLTKQEHESGNVQTAYRLAPDGITQIQIERDPQTRQWIDSVGPNNQPITRGRVSKIDPVSGVPVSTLTRGQTTDSRKAAGDIAKRDAYQKEAAEWEGKEKSYRQNKTIEDQAIRDKQSKIGALYAEKRSWTPQLLGGRSTQEIQSDIDRLSAEIKTHRANSQKFQKDADDAASKATVARRNANANAGSPAVQSPRGARGKIQPNEDANIRDYANQFFHGDYNAAAQAIQAQRNKK